MPHLIAFEKGESREPNLAYLPKHQRSLTQEYYEVIPGILSTSSYGSNVEGSHLTIA